MQPPAAKAEPVIRDKHGRIIDPKKLHGKEPDSGHSVVVFNPTKPPEAAHPDLPTVSFTQPPPPASNGYFLINSNPQASVFRDGHEVGSGMGVRVEVHGGNGTIKVGDGGSPFQLTFHYRISGPNAIELNVDSEPWAVLKKNGIAIGKTPRPGLAGDAHPMRFEFSSPNVPNPMTVVLRYFPS